MPLHYCDLDAVTRLVMLEEVADDAASGNLHLSRWLTATGEHVWPALLRDAVAHGDDATLADDLRRRRLLESHEVRYRSGKPSRAKIPSTAAATLAEAEFNRYYCRAVCRRSLREGDGHVEVYRAKLVKQPRPHSEQMLGALIDAKALLADLREHSPVDVTMGIARPGSGLSVKLPE